MKNQAVLLTPPGAAAIAVVRLRGPGVGEFLRARFSAPCAAGRPVHGVLRGNEGVIDDPVVVITPDALQADINLHGGPWVIQAALRLAEAAGFEIVSAADGPLPDIAAEGDNALEREVFAYLPLARTRQAIAALADQPAAWEKFIATALATQTAPAARSAMLEAAAADCSLHWLLHPPRVAIVGAPNVGKSTLANQLFGQARSITADMPGSTRDWVGEIANIDGLAVELIDTPGIRAASDPIERQAIARSAQEIRGADLVLLVLDATRPLESEQTPLLRAFPAAPRLINKCDLPAAWDVKAMDAIRISAAAGVAMDKVREMISSCFGCDDLSENRPRWWTARQREIIAQAQRNPAALHDIFAAIDRA